MTEINKSEDKNMGGETGKAILIPHACQAVGGQWLHPSPKIRAPARLPSPKTLGLAAVL